MSEDAAARALRELEHTATGVPGRDDEPIPVAGTVLLMRDGDAGLEVLMIRRPDRGSFAGAWVFPGGAVEPADRVPGADETADARRAAAREAAEEVGLRPDAGVLAALSCWEPPTGIRKRVRTWFFVAPAPAGALTASATEVAEAAWVGPADMLARHARGEATLYPPTWVSLHALTGGHGADGLLGCVAAGEPARFRSVIRHDADGTVFVWQPDPAWDAAVPLSAPGPRHRLATAVLPWRYEHP